MSIISYLSNLSVNLIRNKLNYIFLEWKYKQNSHPKMFKFDWSEKKFNRISLVNYLVARTRGWETRYLEIGCANNSLFDSVAAREKIGVDPAQGGTHRMTSDAFFKKNNQLFSVIFIDGLHEYQQVRRDAINALDCIESDGWIAFHDFLPSSWKEHHVPRLQGSWTGDCWKLAVELINAEGLEFKIINIDYGVGLLRKISDEYKIPDMSDNLLNAEFDRFVQEFDNLPIISFEEAVNFVELSIKNP